MQDEWGFLMCKLFAVLDIENPKIANAYANRAIPLITENDNDGLGIMRLGMNGVYSNRWLGLPSVITKTISKPLQKYQEILENKTSESGQPSPEYDAIAIHGRFATCDVKLANTHPFSANGAALMHNGIISNHDQFKKELSTCDSEILLWRYLETNVKENPQALTQALRGVHGYFACVVFNDNGIVDIWKDDTATLFMGHVKGVGTVIATTEEIILKTAKRMKLKVTGLYEILPFSHLRWQKNRTPEMFIFEKDYFAPDALPAPIVADDARTWWQKELDEEAQLQALQTGKPYKGVTCE